MCRFYASMVNAAEYATDWAAAYVLSLPILHPRVKIRENLERMAEILLENFVNHIGNIIT